MNGEFIPHTVAALFTLAIFSFLWKDNPLYKAAESLAVGLSAGYFTVILIRTSLMRTLIDPLFEEGQVLVIIPGILGLLMYLRLTRRWTWISRYPLAFYMGIASGAALSPTILAYVVRQIEYTIVPMGFGSWEGITNILIVVMVFCSLFYFFFSVPHKGVFGGVSRIGIWVIMVAFGAQFGFTVMARISLLIGRVQFLLGDWLGLIHLE
ncbi:MAG: hypothetical protein GF330_05025 [Candidatus Eisenbacteria bacterium]|nr:hypothetical protein [Candidatus Eisenbacteria bacterium]